MHAQALVQRFRTVLTDPQSHTRAVQNGTDIVRVMTDNAKCYGSNAFRAFCAAADVRQTFTRPYTPRTNGKAERFIQTVQHRWAYRRPYRSSEIGRAHV